MRNKPLLIVLAALVALFVSACSSSDVTQEDLDAVNAQLTAKNAELTTKNQEISELQTQISTTAPVTVIQTGELAPAAPGSTASGWATDESIRGGLHLVAQYDSSGPDAWDASAHPLVYFTSESSYNYNEEMNAAKEEGAPNFAGFHIIDAYAKEVIAAGLYQFEGNISRGPHGVGVSRDGKWAYVGFSETPAEGGDRISYIAIVNTRTMKMDKLLKQESYFEGGMRSQALHHVQSFTDFEGNDRVILQWGFGANGGPHHILDSKNDNKVVKAITYDDVKPMGHPFTTPDPTGQYIYISMGANWIRSNHAPAAGIAKLDLATGEHEVIEGVGHHPIGITHTADGRWTYVVDGHGSHVYKIDNEIDEVVGSTSAGVAGPYGIALNWDETEIWLVGKGEGSHNRGGHLGLIDAKTFRTSRAINQPVNLGGSASSVDHAILHPDPAVNELWVSNMKGWETIVLSLDTYEVTDYVPTPNAGDTHSGAFVRYNADYTGELLVDMGGPKSASMWADVRTRVEAAASAR
jgi:DNA-binding beta-propeller fold protein YncE